MNIKENMGNLDRVIRAYIALFLVVAFFHGYTSGIIGYLSLAVAVAFLLNGIFGHCYIYRFLGLDSHWKHSVH